MRKVFGIISVVAGAMIFSFGIVGFISILIAKSNAQNAIIGGADSPTAIFLAVNMAKRFGLIGVAGLLFVILGTVMLLVKRRTKGNN